MHSVLSRNIFFVKEHVGMFKAANNYDILDPQTQEIILQCREDRLGFITRLLRFTDFKRFTRFHIEVRTPTGEPVVTVRRGVALLRSRVQVLDDRGEDVGTFRQKLLSLGGAFTVLDPDGNELCMLKGKWTSWDFRFMSDDGFEFAHVTKKWAGIGRELFTTADNYVVQISDSVEPHNPIRQLILAAALCVDMVLKE